VGIGNQVDLSIERKGGKTVVSLKVADLVGVPQ
jgi:hypothetical protein